MENEWQTSLHSFLCNDLDSHRMDFYGSAEWWIYSIANKKNILKDSSIPGVDLSGRDKLYASLILNITEEINSIPYMESNKGCIKNCPGKILWLEKNWGNRNTFVDNKHVSNNKLV